MRVLLLFRGAPGCGKSTFIDNMGLKPYTLSADDIRMQLSNIQMDPEGNWGISAKNEKVVWSTLFSMLENRMQNGDFTVIDATNSKTMEMNKYRDLAESYRYRTYIVDLTNVPIEVCKAQNLMRPEYKQVPEEVIDKMYARFRTQGIPGRIKIVDKEKLEDEILEYRCKDIDTTKYKKIVHIGDVHGCYTALIEYFKDGIQDDTYYIFTGDYVDRGLENAEVMNFLLSIYNLPNVTMLEGNHERWLFMYANDAASKSKEFEFHTKPQLDKASIDKKLLRDFYRHLGQCVYYKYGDKYVFVCHGGIPKMVDKMVLRMSTECLIKGIGNYPDSHIIADTWESQMPADHYQIHGHRNIQKDPIKVNDHVYNLEGQVEFGGYLRIVELYADGYFNEIAIKNTVFNEKQEEVKDPLANINAVNESNDKDISDTEDLLIKLRHNKYVQEKPYGNISSFNFTHKAFYEGVWNDQTVKARGLYINTNTKEIVCRGFDKFFRVNERPETKIDVLPYKLKFPVTCYVKENGYLGLVSYNSETDDLFITTKSSPEGDFALWFKNLLKELTNVGTLDYLKTYCKENNVTLLFEVIDTEHDPHIIKYPCSRICLLSIVYNEIEFKQMNYDEVKNLANLMGISYKEKAFIFDDWSSFYNWYTQATSEGYKYNDEYIEGFVIEDSEGYMVKIKTEYYNFWKFMRGVSHGVLKCGYMKDTSALYNDMANDFYGYLKNIYINNSKETIEVMDKNIITLREEFFKLYPIYDK